MSSPVTCSGEHSGTSENTLDCGGECPNSPQALFIPCPDLEVVLLALVYKVFSSQPQRTSAGDRHCKCVVTQVCSLEGEDQWSQDCSLWDPRTVDDSVRHKVLWCHMMRTICEVVLCQGSNWCSNMVWHNIRSSYSDHFFVIRRREQPISVRIIQAHARQQGLQVRLLWCLTIIQLNVKIIPDDAF